MNIICGIYGIEGNNDDLYVGQAVDIKKRWSCHSAHLKANEHLYKELQEAYNASTENIKWIILEECSESELEKREDWWIKHADGWNVINKEKFGKKKSKVADVSKMKEAQTGESNGHCCKLCSDDVVKIKDMLANGVKQVAIAEKFGCSPTLISNIKNNNRWASVTGGAF